MLAVFRAAANVHATDGGEGGLILIQNNSIKKTPPSPRICMHVCCGERQRGGKSVRARFKAVCPFKGEHSGKGPRSAKTAAKKSKRESGQKVLNPLPGLGFYAQKFLKFSRLINLKFQKPAIPVY